jgi:hypothetical protein
MDQPNTKNVTVSSAFGQPRIIDDMYVYEKMKEIDKNKAESKRVTQEQLKYIQYSDNFDGVKVSRPRSRPRTEMRANSTMVHTV